MSFDDPSPLPGAALRRLREERGQSAREVADALCWSTSKLSRIETSTSRVKRTDLSRLLEFYRVPENVRSDISALAQRPLLRPRPPVEAVPDPLVKYVRLEEQASQISIYAQAMIPGLLQTPEYAALIFMATPIPEDHLAQARMQMRMVRQAILGRIPPPHIDVILDEVVIHRPIGGDAVMRRQMIRLQELSDRPEIAIRVLPLGVGAHPALPGSFTVLDFSEGLAVPTHVWQDDLAGGLLRTKEDEVERFRSAFRSLEALALTRQESEEVFHEVVTRGGAAMEKMAKREIPVQ